MEAILLVGGRGTRLHPLTLDTPKPMLKMGGVPFIAHQIGYAKAHGVKRIVMAMSYKNEVFVEYLTGAGNFGVEFEFAIEDIPLGTGGAIRNGARFLESSADQPIVILNGDILSAHDLSAQVHFHREMESEITLHLTEVDDARAYGSVPTQTSGRILEFIEKSENPPTNFINAGCYIFNRRIIDEIPKGKVVSIERETFPTLLQGENRLWGYKSSSYWIDIGTPAAFLRASIDLVSGTFHSPVFSSTKEEIFLDSRAVIGNDVLLSPGTSVGVAEIGSGTQIRASVIGDGVTIGAGAQIIDSIIGDGVEIGDRCELRAVVLAGAGVSVPANSRQIQGE